MKRGLLAAVAAATLAAGAAGFNARPAHAQAPPYAYTTASTIGFFTGHQCGQFHFCFNWHGGGILDQLPAQNFNNPNFPYNVNDNGTANIPLYTNTYSGYVTYFRDTIFGLVTPAFGNPRQRFYQTEYGRAGAYQGNPYGPSVTYTFAGGGLAGVVPSFTMTVETINQDIVTVDFYNSGPLAGLYFLTVNGGCGFTNGDFGLFPCNAL